MNANQIIAIKKATKASDPEQPWGDTLAFAYALIQQLRLEQNISQNYPIQPIVKTEHGILRFKENRQVTALLEHSQLHGFGLNELAFIDHSPEERSQLAQLIGYSVGGWSTLSYVSNEQYSIVSEIANKVA
jgi:hypothetical protein